PRMNYTYVRIILDNKSSAPINILDIGEMATDILPTSYEKLRNVSFQQTNDKKTKTSLLSISKDALSPVDMIKLHVNAGMPYHREAELSVPAPTSRIQKTAYYPIREYLTVRSVDSDGFAIAPILEP